MLFFSRNTKPKQQQQQQQQQQPQQRQPRRRRRRRRRQQLCSQPCTVHHSSHVIGFISPVLTCNNLPFLRGGNRHGIFNLLTCGSSAAGLLLPFNRLLLPALEVHQRIISYHVCISQDEVQFMLLAYYPDLPNLVLLAYYQDLPNFGQYSLVIPQPDNPAYSCFLSTFHHRSEVGVAGVHYPLTRIRFVIGSQWIQNVPIPFCHKIRSCFSARIWRWILGSHFSGHEGWS